MNITKYEKVVTTQKKFPHVVYFNVQRDWFEPNSRHQKLYSEGGKIRECRDPLGRTLTVI